MKITKRRLVATFFSAVIIITAAFALNVFAFSSSVDDFMSSRMGRFPHLWRTWPLQRDKAAEVYSVAEEGGHRYIKAYDDHDASQQIFFNFNWQIKNRPNLSWRWRATTLPAGASEKDDATNDSACAIYVIVGKYEGHAIKYVWSSTLPTGTVLSRHDGKLKVKVLDSGSSKQGKWIPHSVDVLSDYESLFGRKLDKNPSGIAILTDGNAVHKPSGCDYTDLKVSGSGE